jgi:uncharacterized RDD family membrane protein YckC
VILGTTWLKKHVRRGSEKLSTLVSQPAPEPSWKQEVNRRLEAHKSRKGLSVVDQNSAPEERSGVSDRAALAAARVAARFSKAPSYTEMQAAEARAALRNAEAATRAALEAQAAAQAVLENLERNERSFVFEQESAEDPTFSDQSRDEADWAFDESSRAVGAGQEPSLASSVDDVPLSEPVTEFAHHQAADWSWAGQPIHANLIQFPRELVATRRIRPRIVDSPETKAGESHGQLSIFEVDPSSISIEPASTGGVETALPAPSWGGPEWSSIELDRDPDHGKEIHPAATTLQSVIDLAPMNLRMMAAAVDFALVIGMVCVGAMGVAGHMVNHMALKTAETGAGVAVVLVAVLYQAFFLLTTMSTPGMMYAGISLCTFDEEFPTRTQLRDRLGALMVSVLPMGLGLAWSIFDEDHLSWHDRLSRTYQRRC